MLKRSVAVLLGASSVLAACGSEPQSRELASDALISYQFLDASVPPQYHRSYELTVTREKSRIVVDSYGDILAEETVPTDPAVWAELGGTLESVLGLAAQEVQQGCTGGTVTSLTVVEGTSALVELVLDECAGANEDATSAVNAWIAPARAQFPAMDQLAPVEE